MSYSGSQSQMKLQPDSNNSNYRPADKLKDKVAIVTGGDSGIGRTLAIATAREGTDVAIIYNVSDEDALDTRQMVERHGRSSLVVKADVRQALRVSSGDRENSAGVR